MICGREGYIWLYSLDQAPAAGAAPHGGRHRTGLQRRTWIHARYAQPHHQDGWNDAQGNENGDKCAWTGLQNIALRGQLYAVQPLWSNAAAAGQGACAVSLGS